MEIVRVPNTVHDWDLEQQRNIGRECAQQFASARVFVVVAEKPLGEPTNMWPIRIIIKVF